jgi:predicted O-methyltransferase YrrM
MRDFAENLRLQITGALSVAECVKLGEVASATAAVQALEVGHYLGLSTAVLLTSLPTDCELVTIDHHQGDAWSGGTSFDTFMQNVEPYVGDRWFDAINGDMRAALPTLGGTFGFVFYDADHTAEAVAEFWRLAAGLLDDRCTLVFDDADWVEQSTLRTLAEADGFVVVTDVEFYRPSGDKHDPLTYTLEVMRRG